MKEGLILSIESSSKICSIAISNNSDLLVEYTISMPNSHDQFLAEFVRRAFQDLQMDTNELSAIAISSGPGSFTGLRIGAAFAKGFCFDNNIKLLPVPTLQAIAFKCKSIGKGLGERIVSLVHSHKDLFFVQMFDSDANPLEEVSLLNLDLLLNNILNNDVVAGIGAEMIHRGKQIRECNYLLASDIAKLGWEFYFEGKFVPPEEFVPSYYFEFQPKAKS